MSILFLKIQCFTSETLCRSPKHINITHKKSKYGSDYKYIMALPHNLQEVKQSVAPFQTGARSNRRLNWLTRPPSIQQGDPWHAFRSVSYRWVNDNPNSRENVARALLEAWFAKPFPKARPSFLRNPKTKRCLELDAWNEELNIAVEFNGIQHAQFPNPFHTTYAQFSAQRTRDALKIDLCKEHNVKLVLIPHTVQRAEIESFLRTELEQELAKCAPPPQLPADDPHSSATATGPQDEEDPEAEVRRAFGNININDQESNN